MPDSALDTALQQFHEAADRAGLTTSQREILTAFKTTGKKIRDEANGVVTPRIQIMDALGSFADPRVAVIYTRSGPARGSVSFSPSGTVDSWARKVAAHDAARHLHVDQAVAQPIAPHQFAQDE